MDAALLSALADSVGACAGLRAVLRDRSATEFHEFLLRPRIFRLRSVTE